MIAGRKILRVPISFPVLSQLMVQGAEFSHVKCVKGLPKDAILVSSHFNESEQVAYLVFMHESFDEVPWGCVMPELKIEHE